jgi:hypothetical protein
MLIDGCVWECVWVGSACIMHMVGPARCVVGTWVELIIVIVRGERESITDGPHVILVGVKGQTPFFLHFSGSLCLASCSSINSSLSMQNSHCWFIEIKYLSLLALLHQTYIIINIICMLYWITQMNSIFHYSVNYLNYNLSYNSSIREVVVFLFTIREVLDL